MSGEGGQVTPAVYSDRLPGAGSSVVLYPLFRTLGPMTAFLLRSWQFAS